MRKIGHVHKWLKERKEIVATALVVLATIAAYFNTSWQASKSDLQSVLIYKMAELSASYGAFGANDAELSLQRSMQEWCLNNQSSNPIIKGSCGSNQFLIREAAYAHDPLEGEFMQVSDEASSTLSFYNSLSPIYDEEIKWSNRANLTLLVAALSVLAL